MAKLAHLFVLAALIVWLAGSGCIGNNDEEETGIAPGPEAGNGDNSEGLTQAEIQEINDDMIELENLLANASVEEEIVF
ncbi:hypothetical protein RSJ42_07830 [Methanosarcina hadiensis]|uniref:hypothetical protein n=1 Tax=Methanosarcina hadiensis TaxID=3078083 RepID=UPI00397777D0